MNHCKSHSLPLKMVEFYLILSNSNPLRLHTVQELTGAYHTAQHSRLGNSNRWNWNFAGYSPSWELKLGLPAVGSNTRSNENGTVFNCLILFFIIVVFLSCFFTDKPEDSEKMTIDKLKLCKRIQQFLMRKGNFCQTFTNWSCLSCRDGRGWVETNQRKSPMI